LKRPVLESEADDTSRSDTRRHRGMGSRARCSGRRQRRSAHVPVFVAREGRHVRLRRCLLATTPAKAPGV